MRRMAAYVLAGTLAMVPAGAQAQIEVLDLSGGARPEAVAEDGPEPPADGMAEPVMAAEIPDDPLPVCGMSEIAIAEMGWPSAAILAHIHALLLQTEFECSVRLVPGEPESTLSSMVTTQQPAVAPELWVSRQADVWNGAMQAGSARAASPSFTGGPLEAWFVPAYVIANNPGLTRATDIMDHWRVFVAEGEERARLLSCPSEWACAIINRNMAAGLGLDARFEIVEPFDRFTMDGYLADAVARRAPVLGYYWQPNALIDRLGLVPLDMGPFDPGNAQCMAIRDCVPFGGSGFAPDTVVIAVAEWVFTEVPDIADYFARAAMPLAEMNRLLAWQAEHEAGPEAVAQHFLITGRAIWRPWAGETAVPAGDEEEP
ncbi:MAG TPA: glycine betaine ABC transporter substrate-binding protein [Pelagibacterium sp.]|uniref:glycine betaine ABC transporter substrate-binding protein n=1 Tax=Pelagibacterium sp. TaxID=1967288 RepID=UPI002BB95D3E|nr:glycine betaine ABC transporter substrate-binding protein [Pelagibacterium sp.]HWJ88679.1 glycine betaine ABC transporter substrate-binding protein [Pelagibacterium sp.]